MWFGLLTDHQAFHWERLTGFKMELTGSTGERFKIGKPKGQEPIFLQENTFRQENASCRILHRTKVPTREPCQISNHPSKPRVLHRTFKGSKSGATVTNQTREPFHAGNRSVKGPRVESYERTFSNRETPWSKVLIYTEPLRVTLKGQELLPTREHLRKHCGVGF